MIAPRPSEWNIEDGTISMPHSANTTVKPLNRTVLPAVAPALDAASMALPPCLNSSLNRETISSE